MNDKPLRPLIFGEVLFDEFDGEIAVLGGAPFNVAWHLQGFGLRPLLVSCVGADERGDQVLAGMAAWGMDTSGVQIDAVHPTGRVQVLLRAGQPSFEIVPEQAYDFIGGAALDALSATPWSLLYHGTLAARSERSRASLIALIDRLRLPVFVDVNLRDPWWTPASVDHALAAARWLKLNEQELVSLLGLQQLPSPAALIRQAQALCIDQRLDMVIVTRGAEGAILTTAEEQTVGRPGMVRDLQDTVGAGDAFSAVVILGLTHGWASAIILERALTFAAAICEVRGATVADPTLYARFREAWGL